LIKAAKLIADGLNNIAQAITEHNELIAQVEELEPVIGDGDGDGGEDEEE
jgi:hypothetical protein